MKPPITMGLAAGLATAVVYVSAARGTSAGLLGLFLPLPIFLAGLGWGWRSAAIGALAGGAVALYALPNVGETLFLLAYFTVPAVWLTYLAGLHAEVDDGTDKGGAGGTGVVWYPLDRLLIWITILGGGLGAAYVLAAGLDEAAFRTTFTAAFERMLDEVIVPAMNQPLTTDQRAWFIAQMLAWLPAMISAGWMLSTVLNFWLAGRISRASGRLPRPWPDLHAMTLPVPLLAAAPASAVLALAPGLMSRVGTAAAGAVFFAALLAGLASLHARSRTNPARPLILTMIYVGLMVLGLLGAVPLVLLAMAEPVFGWRRPAATPRPGNRGPPSA